MEEASHLVHLRELHDRVRSWQPWSRSLVEVADNLGVDPSRGLDQVDAHNRHTHFGPNIPVDLSHETGVFSVFIEEVTEPMMLLLLSVGIMYSIWGDPLDAATIFVTILAVVGLEVLTEWRAKNALASLSNTVPTNTTVLREGKEGVVSADELVPGDVILLVHGQSVPADAVVVVSHRLSVDESMLTGESANVYKTALNSSPEDRRASGFSIPQNEYEGFLEIPSTLVCAGTTVTSGRAVCVVVAVGSRTEVAMNIASLIQISRPPPSPTQLKMKRLAGILSVVAVCICIFIFVAGIIQGMPWRSALLMSMSLAFATIPEELPLISKASLALGARQLARHKLLIRRLNAADSLSSVSVIITDKTGTLTRNKLIVSSILVIGSENSGDGSDNAVVEIITPESVAGSEKNSTLVAPLYSAWSLSVDPLEAKPLHELLGAVHAACTGSSRSSLSSAIKKSTSRYSQYANDLNEGSSFRPFRGLGKDFMNTAVLQSLAGNADIDIIDALCSGRGIEFQRDPETDQISILSIAEPISTICRQLPEPTGELPFNPALRISSRTRSPAKAPTSYSTPGESSLNRKISHWTVVKGAPEVLLPRCNRVWRASDSKPLFTGSDIENADINGLLPLTGSFAQTISRSATDLAAGGSRIIAYAIAVTDTPINSPSTERNSDSSENENGFARMTSTLDQEHNASSTKVSEPGFRFENRDGDQRASAGRKRSRTQAMAAEALPSNMIFVGAFAFYDPPERETSTVIRECQNAGIRVILATGDHPSTALAVANAVGIDEVNSHAAAAGLSPSTNQAGRQELALPGSPDHHPYSFQVRNYGAIHMHGTRRLGALQNSSEVHAVTGDMVQASLENRTFGQLIDESNVFSRVTPAQKLLLVQHLQARGEVVAFIGDGINDAPSLTRADVGICMGGSPSTSDVAMDSAGLIVLSGRFNGVVRCLREGFRLRTNIDKCMIFYISCKIALISLFTLLLLVEGSSPMTPIQVIFLELFMDLGATWTFLTETAEGVPASGSELKSSLSALSRVQDEINDYGSAGQNSQPATTRGQAAMGGFLGGGRAMDLSVLLHGFALLVACLLPLIIPSILLPSWAVAPVAPTLTFLTWMLAHSLMGTSLRTRLVPLRVHKTQNSPLHSRHGMAMTTTQSFKQAASRMNLPGTAWLSISILAVILAVVIPSISVHLDVVRLDAVEWVMVIVSPILLFVVLELCKEIRFARFKRKYNITATPVSDENQPLFV